MGEHSNACYTQIQIIPIWIELFNQPNFPGSIPFFQSLLAPDRVFSIIELFEINESSDLVSLRKAFRQFQAMLGHATDKVVSHADVKRTSDAAGKDVDVEAVCATIGRLWNTGSPGQAGR